MFNFIHDFNLIILEFLDTKASSNNELYIYLNRIYLELLKIYDEGFIYVIIYYFIKISFEIYIDIVYHLDHYNIYVGFIAKQKQLEKLNIMKILSIKKFNLFNKFNKFNYMFIIRKKQYRIKFFPEKKKYKGHLFQHEFPFLLLYKRESKKKVPLVYCFREQNYLFHEVLTIYQQYIVDIRTRGLSFGVLDKHRSAFDIFRKKNKKIYVLLDLRLGIGFTFSYIITKIIHQYFFVTTYDNYLNQYSFSCSEFDSKKKSIAQEILLKEFIINFFFFKRIENLFSRGLNSKSKFNFEYFTLMDIIKEYSFFIFVNDFLEPFLKIKKEYSFFIFKKGSNFLFLKIFVQFKYLKIFKLTLFNFEINFFKKANFNIRYSLVTISIIFNVFKLKFLKNLINLVRFLNYKKMSFNLVNNNPFLKKFVSKQKIFKTMLNFYLNNFLKKIYLNKNFFKNFFYLNKFNFSYKKIIKFFLIK